MTDQAEELFVRSVEVGVANVDLVTADDVINTQAVVQRAVAHDPRTGEERRLLLVYDPANITAVIDALRAASVRALADSTS